MALAISAAQSLGISLRPCPPTQGTGFCMFEACIPQLCSELRDDERNEKYWREKVADFVQSSCLAYSRYYRKESGRAGTKQEQWNNDWYYLRQSENYNCRARDLLLPGLAACMKRDILVFHTDSRANKMYSIHLAEILGAEVKHLRPLVLCFDGTHYEGLEPSSEDDIKKCVLLTRGNCPEIVSSVSVDSPQQDLGQPKLVRDEHRYPGTLNICFVNATVQILSVSGIATFLCTELPGLLSTASPQDYPVARALAILYSSDAGGMKSAANLRR